MAQVCLTPTPVCFSCCESADSRRSRKLSKIYSVSKSVGYVCVTGKASGIEWVNYVTGNVEATFVDVGSSSFSCNLDRTCISVKMKKVIFRLIVHL